MTRLAFIASAVALALGITIAHATHPLLGLPCLFACAFFADLYQRRRATEHALQNVRARVHPPGTPSEFTPCCQFWSSSAGDVHSPRCRTRRSA